LGTAVLDTVNSRLAATSSVTITGPVTTGKIWTLTIGTTTFTYTATAGNTAGDVAAALVAKINLNPTYHAASTGDAAFSISKAGGGTFTAAFSTDPSAGTGTVTYPTATRYAHAEFVLTPGSSIPAN